MVHDESLTAPDLQEPRTRRRHQKSRAGCGICKRRKIKCDERKPCCANCARHGVECDFPRPTATFPQSTNAAPGSPLNQTQEPAANSVVIPDDLAGGTSCQIPVLEAIHLELLHNFTTLTSQTLSGDPVLKNLWRINVPKVGFSHDFVMRSIFALSALHMSLFASEKREFYLNIARSEHGAALREISSVLSHVTAENCSAIYITATLTFIYAWACPRQPGDFFLVSNSGVAEWVFLMQGVRSISETWRTELRQGPFSPMFRLGHSRMEYGSGNYRTSAAWLSSVEHTQLMYLRRTVIQATSDTLAATIYQESIENLETCFCSVLGASSNSSPGQSGNPMSPHDVIGGGALPVAPVVLTSTIYAWLYRMDHGFIELLVRRDSLALVIFAHFCVLIKFLSGCWWMYGWSTHLLQEIWDLLDEEHRLWIRWPIEEIGWRPRV
ncbi:uncharacterized protein TrAFT101_009459 [Trichoderma asperellum]|uniref:uncharacterized protein n=1 Tax=Trichoderma asperellum TaxID=101201 RepID=UPI003324AE50|nr:hypothetical protein TrAFT101_009459 [Trichoderma asperellum]